MDELECRLIREDGTEWRVRKLMRRGHGLRVDADRIGGEGGASPRGDGEAPSDPGPPTAAPGGAGNGGRGSGQGPGGRNGHLADEPLARGDRIEWTTGDGRVVWAMRVPLAAGEGPDLAGTAGPRPGAA